MRVTHPFRGLFYALLMLVHLLFFMPFLFFKSPDSAAATYPSTVHLNDWQVLHHFGPFAEISEVKPLLEFLKSVSGTIA